MLVGDEIPNKVNPENIVDAQFSMYYHVAVAWLYGHNDWTSYEYINNEDVHTLSRQIRVSVDELMPDESLLTSVKISGKTVTIEYPVGESQNPTPSTAVEKKFLQLAENI